MKRRARGQIVDKTKLKIACGRSDSGIEPRAKSAAATAPAM